MKDDEYGLAAAAERMSAALSTRFDEPFAVRAERRFVDERVDDEGEFWPAYWRVEVSTRNANPRCEYGLALADAPIDDEKRIVELFALCVLDDRGALP